MTVRLNTRGRERQRDYRFIGSAPPTTWWRAYADHTTFERPTVLVQADGDRWQGYLSGIPSARRDAVGTVIRYTLVLEGATTDVREADADPGTGAPGTGDLLALVANWLADQDRGRGDGRVSSALDAAFAEPDVERLIDDAGPAADREVQRRVGDALRALELPATRDAPEAAGDWLADLGRASARAAFLHRVDALLAGQPGRALVLNLVGSPTDVAALLDDGRPLAVLAPDLPDPSTIVPLRARERVPDRSEPAKKFRPPPPMSTRESAGRSVRGCLRLILVPVALLVALVLAVFGTILVTR